MRLRDDNGIYFFERTLRRRLLAIALLLAVMVGLIIVALTVAAPAGARVFRGTGGDDFIRGTNSADRIYAGRGNDSVQGRRGADFIRGGPGQDTLQGGRGRDYIDAQDGEADGVACGRGKHDFAQVDAGLDVVADNCEVVGGLGLP